MKIKYATISKTGRRSNNEDSFKILEMPEHNRFMGIVCDGMGGHSFGEVASRAVCMPSTRNPTTSAMQRWVLRWSWPALKVTR